MKVKKVVSEETPETSTGLEVKPRYLVVVRKENKVVNGFSNLKKEVIKYLTSLVLFNLQGNKIMREDIRKAFDCAIIINRVLESKDLNDLLMNVRSVLYVEIMSLPRTEEDILYKGLTENEAKKIVRKVKNLSNIIEYYWVGFDKYDEYGMDIITYK